MSNETKDQKMAKTEDDKQVEYLKATLAMARAKKFPSKQSGFKLVTIIEPEDGGDLVPIYRNEE